MLIVLFSAKGGAGTTVVAAALGLSLARHDDRGVLLVDLAGDLPATLNVATPEGEGVGDWLAAGPDVPVDAWARLALPVADRCHLVPRGRTLEGPHPRADVLVDLLLADDRVVVVDAGTLPAVTGIGAGQPTSVAAQVVAGAPTAWAVTRCCYLALRRLSGLDADPTGVVVVHEPGRALGPDDVRDVVGVPVVATVTAEQQVARAVDAGLLVTRLPRSLARALADAT